MSFVKGSVQYTVVVAAVLYSVSTVGGVCAAFTSVCIFSTEVMPVAKQQLDPVALINRQQQSQEKKNRTQSTSQLHCVHELY